MIALTPLKANKCGKLVPTRCRTLRDRQSCPPSTPYTTNLVSCPYSAFFYVPGFTQPQIPPDIRDIGDGTLPWRIEQRMSTGGVAGTIRATWDWYDGLGHPAPTPGTIEMHADGTLIGYTDVVSGVNVPFGTVAATTSEVVLVAVWKGGSFADFNSSFTCPS